MAEQAKRTVSFGFSKKSEKRIISSATSSNERQDEPETEFITSVEDREVKSTKPKEEKKELIIPLIKRNTWRRKTDASSTDPDKPPPSDSLDSQALSEIINDAAKQNDSWDARGKPDTNLEIPLLMQNKVPDGFETDDQLDVSLRPEEPEEAAYEEIPIEQFGMALLKGMGWKPGEGIGRNNKAVKPVEAVLRPKGMGLGADRKQAQDLNSAKQASSDRKQDESAELRLKKGAFCLIENGTHKDLYGSIEGLDEDNARLMIKLTVSGKLVTVSQYNIKLVTVDEYNKYSKYLNKGAADRYKEKEDRKKDKGDRDEDRDKGRDRKDRERDRESSREHKHRKEDRQLSPDRERGSKHREKDSEEKPSKKRKHVHKSSSQSSSQSNGDRSRSMWVRANLRVRLVDEHFKKGRYFNTKLTIVDVFDRDHCVCRTDDGKVLEEISESMLETVIPKSDSAYVCIVSGKYKGQIALVMERNKKKYEALLQLLSDRDKVLQLDYGSICEYVGDINEEFDY